MMADDGVRWVDVVIPVDHPAFAGHFPGAPVLPGVSLVCLVLEAIAADAELSARLGGSPRIDELKFLAPVGPGATLRIGLTPRGNRIDFEVRMAGTAAARGRLSPAVSA